MNWIMAHAIWILLGYLALTAVIGSMPKLPEGASYRARWAYGALQAFSLNLRFAMNFFKLPTPEDKQ